MKRRRKVAGFGSYIGELPGVNSIIVPMFGLAVVAALAMTGASIDSNLTLNDDGLLRWGRAGAL